jgi:hypothetical protein
VLGSIRLAGDPADLYPLEGDSAKYHQIGQGFARVYAHPAEAFRLWVSHGARPEDLAPYGFDSWVLQHAPAYTALLGAAYLLPGEDVAAGRRTTLLLFAIGAAALFWLGRACFGPAAAALASAPYLLWPAHAVFATAVLTEIPVLTAALVASAVLLATARSVRWRDWVLGGLFLGIVVLTKTTLRFLVVPLVLLEVWLDPAPSRARAWKRAAGRLAGWGATQALWLIFLWGFQLSANPLAKTGDDWLWIYRGNYVPDRGWENIGIGDPVTPELERALEAAGDGPKEERRAAVYRGAFIETARENPGGLLALMIAKAGIFWRFPAVKTRVEVGPLGLPPPARLQPAVAVLGLLGLALCMGEKRRWLLPAAFPVYLTLLHAGTHLVSRYNVPAVPFAMLYGSGMLAACVAVVRSAAPRLRTREGWRIPPSASSGLGLACAVAAGSLVACAFLLRGDLGLRWLAPLVVAAACLPLAIRIAGPGRLGLLRGASVLGLLGILASGTLANDPDRDLRRVHLSRPGEGVRLTLRLPQEARPERFTNAEVLLDLLPSERGKITLSIRAAGEEIGRWTGRPPSDAGNFLFDPNLHSEEDRYRRWLRSADTYLEGNLRRRRGMADAGYDQFRQWHRVPVEPARAFRSGEITLELLVVEAQGGSVDLFLDRGVPAQAGPAGRTIAMPAVSDNPFEYSNYRFDALATDRRLADARLIRRIQVLSMRERAERFDARGEVRVLSGEPRLRLRGRLVGGHALVRDDQGRLRPEFLPDPGKGVRPLESKEIRILQADREFYRDGTVLF